MFGPPQEHPLLVEGGGRERNEEAVSARPSVVYVVPITSILGRLPLIPAGDQGTIPVAMRHRKKELFEYGKCDESARPGTCSKLYYINLWAMCWPSNHAKKPLTG